VAASRQDWNDERFRDWAADWLRREAVEVDARARAAVVRSSRYQRLDLADPASVMACLAGEGPVAVYLALPPSVFATAVSAIHRVGLPADSQVVLEKPFGEDLDSARALNRLLAQLADERHVFRVDHVLAMTTVQNVLGTRLANRVLEPLWNSAHIEQVEIIWEETLALEGRAGYYDHVGALKDMVQNHLRSSSAWWRWSRRSASANVICATARWASCGRCARSRRMTSPPAPAGADIGPAALATETSPPTWRKMG
jgi:glucose-6-phosphate 1-dehydrogenase